MGLPLSRAVPSARALLVASVLALAAPALAESWSARDVEAAERYRAEERERAARYRAALEEKARPAPEPRAAAEGRRAPETRLGARLADWLRARLGELVARVFVALEDWLVRSLDAVLERFEAPPSRHELRASRRGEPLADWLSREEGSARRLLDELAPELDPAAEREARRRDAERAREWARRRGRETGPAPWEDRWRDSESWERLERR